MRMVHPQFIGTIFGLGGKGWTLRADVWDLAIPVYEFWGRDHVNVWGLHFLHDLKYLSARYYQN